MKILPPNRTHFHDEFSMAICMQIHPFTVEFAMDIVLVFWLGTFAAALGILDWRLWCAFLPIESITLLGIRSLTWTEPLKAQSTSCMFLIQPKSRKLEVEWSPIKPLRCLFNRCWDFTPVTFSYRSRNSA